MAEPQEKPEITAEGLFRSCLRELPTEPPARVVRVELHGVARFVCWWFIIWSIIGVVVALAVLASR